MTEEEKENLRLQILAVSPIVAELVFSSDPLQRSYDQLRASMYLREPGCWMADKFGAGKTTALNYFYRALKAELPNQAAFLVNEQALPGNELRSFFVRALTESGQPHSAGSVASKLRNQLATHWAELSETSPLKCVVLFLDEGQSIRPADEDLLKDLWNEIKSHGGGLLTFIVGESPSFDRHVSLRRKTGNGASDRLFGGHRLPLFTYRKLEDWASLFREMHQKVFADLGGRTLYQAYLGHLEFDSFKIDDDAAAFWKAHSKLKKNRININLRRTFVAINFTMMNFALQSIKNDVRKFCGIPVDDWYNGLLYGVNKQ